MGLVYLESYLRKLEFNSSNITSLQLHPQWIFKFFVSRFALDAIDTDVGAARERCPSF